MSIESAQAFLERIKTDEEFAKNVTECPDAEARMAFVKVEGYDFTADEIKEQTSELSEEDFDSVAAGGAVGGWLEMWCLGRIK